jgi:hypothetical protein
MKFTFAANSILVPVLMCTGCQPSGSDKRTVAPQTSVTWNNPPQGLEFLRTVGELRGISLEISEPDFLKLIDSQDLKVEKSSNADGSSYYISTKSGENIVVMFGEGVCTGIQRLQPTPVPMP